MYLCRLKKPHSQSRPTSSFRQSSCVSDPTSLRDRIGQASHIYSYQPIKKHFFIQEMWRVGSAVAGSSSAQAPGRRE